MINKIVTDTLWSIIKMGAKNKSLELEQTPSPEFLDGLDYLSDLGVVEFIVGEDPNVVREEMKIKLNRAKSLLKLLREWEKEDKDMENKVE